MKIKLFFFLPLLIACACNSAPSNKHATSSQAKPIEELIVGTWKNEKSGNVIAFYTDKIFTSQDGKGVKDGTYAIINNGKIIELQFKEKEKVQSEIITLTESDLKLKEGDTTSSYKKAA